MGERSMRRATSTLWAPTPTGSSDFPTTVGAFQNTHRGSWDVFVAA